MHDVKYIFFEWPLNIDSLGTFKIHVIFKPKVVVKPTNILSYALTWLVSHIFTVSVSHFKTS